MLLPTKLRSTLIIISAIHSSNDYWNGKNEADARGRPTRTDCQNDTKLVKPMSQPTLLPLIVSRTLPITIRRTATIQNQHKATRSHLGSGCKRDASLKLIVKTKPFPFNCCCNPRWFYLFFHNHSHWLLEEQNQTIIGMKATRSHLGSGCKRTPD